MNLNLAVFEFCMVKKEIGGFHLEMFRLGKKVK